LGFIVLGIEGTAWNLSAAIVDESNIISEVTKTYSPEKGGIHPREAAQHHAKQINGLLDNLLNKYESKGFNTKQIDAIAFSQGPGLGQCLRTVATAARALSLSLEIPLIGVNHCIAHIEIGKWKTSCVDPVVLYVSGANSQLIAYRKSKYRVFGETLDIGLGNALDKFARNAGMGHPGGPKIEKYAKLSNNYVELPYVVKGMDFSFSGISTAATQALDENSIEDVCYSLQETVFSMLVEVTERAIAHTEKKEFLLAGGVGANKRLTEMLKSMCHERGVSFYCPETRFMGDNGVMIAYTGLLMFKAGNRLNLEDSHVNPNYRPDTVNVNWIDSVSKDVVESDRMNLKCNVSLKSGAEAELFLDDSSVIKRRKSKKYRLKSLDDKLRKNRNRSEARLIYEARRCGVPTPIIEDITDFSIKMEFIDGFMLKDIINPYIAEIAGKVIGKMHSCGIIHGDLTTSNIIYNPDNELLYLIDFGLSYISNSIESQGVDIHVLFQTFESTHSDYKCLIEAFSRGYIKKNPNAKEVISRVNEIKRRGRYA